VSNVPAKQVKVIVNAKDGVRNAYANEIKASEVALLEPILKLFDEPLLEIRVRAVVAGKQPTRCASSTGTSDPATARPQQAFSNAYADGHLVLDPAEVYSALVVAW